MKKYIALILAGIVFSCMRHIEASITQKTSCKDLEDGQPCTINEVYKRGSKTIEGNCLNGVCRIPATVMIRNETDPSLQAWRIRCSTSTKERMSISAGNTEFITVPAGEHITCKPCSRFGLCRTKDELDVTPLEDNAFAWDGNKWAELGQRIID